MVIDMTFNQKVWNALRQIPRGKVATYSSIAKQVGSPKASRAVGNACNRNEHAPVVPCHRVVASDGNLGGYAGGLKKKIQLLKKEGIEIDIQNNKIANFDSVKWTK